jgi:hypothetical protein
VRGDVLSQVAAPLELGQDAEDEQQMPLTLHVVIRSEQLCQNLDLEVVVDGVDQLVACDEGPCCVPIGRNEYLRGFGKRLAHQAKQPQHFLVEPPELVEVCVYAMWSLGDFDRCHFYLISDRMFESAAL